MLRDFLFLDRCFSSFLPSWLFAWLAYHVAGDIVHVLLVIALISLIIHFVSRGRRR